MSSACSYYCSALWYWSWPSWYCELLNERFAVAEQYSVLYCELLNERIAVAERFVRARGLVKTDPEEMNSVCNSLLAETDIEQSVRVGDVFALLVEYHTSQGDHQSGYTLIEQMRDRNIVLSHRTVRGPMVPWRPRSPGC